MAVFIVIVSGFIVTSRSDFQFILLGFVLGLVTVFAIERLKEADGRRGRAPAPKAAVLSPASASYPSPTSSDPS